MTSRMKVRDHLLDSMKVFQMSEPFDAAEYGRGFFKHVAREFPHLLEDIIGEKEMTADDVQRSYTLENQGKDLILGFHVLAHFFPEQTEFDLYVGMVVRSTSAILRKTFWNDCVKVFLSYLKMFGSVSNDQQEAWDCFEEALKNALNIKDKSRGPRTLVLRGLSRVTQEDLLAELNSYGRLTKYQGLLVPSSGLIDGLVLATYSFEQSAQKALEEFGKKKIDVALLDRPPKRDNKPCKKGSTWFCFDYTTDDNEEVEEEEKPQEDIYSIVQNPLFVPPTPADADSSVELTGLQLLQFYYGDGSSDEE